MEIFTLTLTLSLKGEGIAELRKSYVLKESGTDLQIFGANEGIQKNILEIAEPC